MAQLSRRERIARALCIALGAYLLAGFAASELGEWLLRFRAERLLADLQLLREHPSNWSHFAAFQTRWGKWGHYEGTCTPAQCDYTVSLDGTLRALFAGHWRIDRISEDSRFRLTRGLQYLVWPVMIASHDHMPGVESRVVLEQGTLRLQNVSLYLWVNRGDGPGDDDGGPARENEVPYSSGEYTLIAGLEWQDHNLDRDRYMPALGWPEQDPHTESMVRRPSGCENCISATSVVTPYTSAREAAQLTQLNLNCITRWKPCTYEGDVLPSGFRRQQEDLELRRAQRARYAVCDYPLQQLYDSAENAARMTVTASTLTNGYPSTTVRLDRQLKGAEPLAPDHDYLLYMADPAEHDLHTWPQGAQLLVLFPGGEEPKMTPPILSVYPCGVLPALPKAP